KTGHTQNTQQKHIHNNQANGKTTKKQRTQHTRKQQKKHPHVSPKTSSCFPKNILMFSKNMNMNLQTPQNTNTTTANSIATHKKKRRREQGKAPRCFSLKCPKASFQALYHHKLTLKLSVTKHKICSSRKKCR
ncbi:MAG: hypothetical protein K2F69_00005, partial [Bacteroidaceae bacterium]|nr:hypothetical protein [Bacteroidaceae bacterium]